MNTTDIVAAVCVVAVATFIIAAGGIYITFYRGPAPHDPTPQPDPRSPLNH